MLAPVSGAEFLASFFAAALDHVLAGFCAHALKEAMRTLAFEIAGLKCTFHGVLLYYGVAGHACRGRGSAEHAAQRRVIAADGMTASVCNCRIKSPASLM